MLKPDAKPKGSMFHALHIPNYRFFFLGQLVGLIGRWSTMIALSWLIFRLTQNPFMLGLLGFCLHAPTFFVSPFAGVLVDRLSRRGMLLVAKVLEVMIVAVLVAGVYFEWIEAAHILFACVLLGALKGCEMPARMALVADLVGGREHLSNAVALNASIFHSSRLIGPIFAGALLLPLGGELLCFLFHIGTYLVSVTCFLRIRLDPVKSRPPRPFLGELAEGFRYAFGDSTVRPALLLTACFALLGQPFNSLLPVFASDVLGGGSATFGLLTTAAGAGALLGTLFLASLRGGTRMSHRIAWAVPAFGISLFCFAYSASLPLSLGLLVLCGFSSIVTMVGCNTIIQNVVPNELRGRVMSIVGMLFMGGLPLGSLFLGWVASHLGVNLAVALAAALCGLLALSWLWHLRARRATVR